MAFIITLSKIEDDNFGQSVKVSRVKQASEKQAERLLKGEGTHFKLYDDDGNHYFSGKYLGDPDSLNAFDPLDWAEGNYGCTEIKYRQADGTYQSL